ncbi:MAG: lipoprotein intramolecular transacylase Lit [Chloroflexota bacterium]
MRFANIIGIILIAGTLPFLLVLSNVRWLARDAGFYTRGFAAQEVARTTGMTQGQLDATARQITTYFDGGPAVDLVVEKEWGKEPVFNAKEAGHLDDVRVLLRQIFSLQSGLTLLFGLGVAATLLKRPGGRLARLARRIVAGGLVSLLLFLGLLVGAFLDFSTLFLDFHLVSFTNLDWMLDPRTDYMIRLFPYGFWYDSAVTLIGVTLLESVGLLVAGLGYLRVQGRGRSQSL